MAKIKKRGLDYFPINTDFLQSRLMRRIMKREGDVAPTVLLQVFSAIYAGEGYYVTADSLFYDDLADCFYRLEPEDVERIIALAVEYGLFDAALFQQYGILTAADIQQQFLFSKKRHTIESIDPRYCLLPAEGEEEEEEGEAEAETVQCSAPKRVSKSKKSVTKSKKSVTFSTENVTFRPKNDEKAPFGTHSIEQNSKEQQSTAEQSKENPLLKVSPETGGDEPAERRREKPAERREEDFSGSPQGERTDAGTVIAQTSSAGSTAAQTISAETTGARQSVSAKPGRPAPREWTLADIDRLHPPVDGQRRNLDGLKLNLRQFNIPPREQYAIILKSNFGVIGHPIWKGFNALRESHGKIRLPGHYLLSLCK